MNNSIKKKSKVLVIEDDPLSVFYIESCLANSTYEIIGVAGNELEAFDALNSLSHDVLIADIRLKDSLIFSVLDKFNSIQFPIIFITSHLEDNIYYQTTKYSNSLFISKPFHKFSLISALNKLVVKDSEETYIKIIVKNSNLLILANNVKYIFSEGNYSTLTLYNGRKFSKKKPLKYYEENYKDHFFRINRNYLVNKTELSLENISNKLLKLDDFTVPIGRQYFANINKF